MSEFNPLGRFPSLRQVESPAAAPVETPSRPAGPVAPGRAALRDDADAGGSGRGLGSRVVQRGDAGAAAVARADLPALDPRDGESLNVLVMALAAAAKSGRLTDQKIGRLVEQVLATQVNPQRAVKQLPPLDLSADMLAHLVRRVGRNARQFFASAEPRLGDFQNYQAVMGWAASRVLASGGLLHYGMLRQALFDGLPAGSATFGPLERGWLDVGIRQLLAAMDGASRETDEVLADAADLLAHAGPDAHPAWLETAMIALTAGDRPAAGSRSTRTATPAPQKPAVDAKHVPADEAYLSDADIARATARDTVKARHALEGLVQPQRRQEQLMRAVLAWNPQASPQQLFGAMRGVGRGVMLSGLVEDADLGAMMHALVHRALRRGVTSPDQLPAMIAGLAEGLRDAHPKKAKALGGKLNERLAAAVVAAGGKQLGPFAREIAQHSLKPDFAVREGYLDAMKPALRPRDDKK